MDTRDTINKLLETIEAETTFPVTVVEDAKLTTFSGLSIARGSVPTHVIRLNPKHHQFRDYMIAYQCGFILRFFWTQPGDRWDFAPSQSGRFNVEKLVNRLDVAKTLPPRHVESFCDQILVGLMTHLRSTPIGLRVEDWIAGEFPMLADQQRIAVEAQVSENLLPHQSAVRKATPPLIYDATMAISAAYAIHYATRMDQPQFVLPYEASGHAETGRALHGILDQIEDSPGNDRKLIDSWAAKLGIEKWHTWLPYQEP